MPIEFGMAGTSPAWRRESRTLGSPHNGGTANAQSLLGHDYREIKDPAKLAAYAKLAPVALAPFGVRYLCRGNPNATYESGLKERLVVSEFPSLDKAIAGHDSPGYQEALRALGDGAVRDIRIIEGLE